jgi:pilus assembly protein Flp/PilA
MLSMILSSFNREEGQSLAEYALILALIAVACILVLTALGGGISTALQGVIDELT